MDMQELAIAELDRKYQEYIDAGYDEGHALNCAFLDGLEILSFDDPDKN